jgi:hypothetical protein
MYQAVLSPNTNVPAGTLSTPFSSAHEGIEEHVAAFALATKLLEHREPILVAGHGLAVDQARTDPEPVYSFKNEG